MYRKKHSLERNGNDKVQISLAECRPNRPFMKIHDGLGLGGTFRFGTGT